MTMTLEERLAEKAAIREAIKDDITTLIAESEKLEGDTQEIETTLRELQSRPADRLFRALIGQYFTMPEVNALLLGAFGPKITSTGKESKTPQGKGEVIRKRVVRAYQATSYCLDPESDCPKFLEGVDMETITPIVSDLISETPSQSVFTVYDVLGSLKEKEKVPSHLNANAILKLAKAIVENAGTIADDAKALEAYAGLHEALGKLWEVSDMVNGKDKDKGKAKAA